MDAWDSEGGVNIQGNEVGVSQPMLVSYLDLSYAMLFDIFKMLYLKKVYSNMASVKPKFYLNLYDILYITNKHFKPLSQSYFNRKIL